MRPIVLLLIAAAPIANAAAPPTEVALFARGVPGYFARLEEYVAKEITTQHMMNESNGTVLRHRVLESDLQIAHLGEDPATLWEFRFVRSVDGRKLDAERQMDDFFRLRHPSAAAERRSVVALAIDKSLPGCYWHNLTLTLLAFGPEIVGDFEWERRGDRFAFRQVRGLGIPENLFDPASPRHYPKGTMTFDRAGGWLSRLDLEWTTGERRVRLTMTFSPPAEPGGIALPRRYEAVHERLSTGLVTDRTTCDFSLFRRFTVTTGESTPDGASFPPNP